MGKRTIHMCLSVRGILSRWCEDPSLPLGFTHDDGTQMTPTEAHEALLDELAMGHVVIPIGPPCEGFDYSGKGCPGHAVEGGRPNLDELTHVVAQLHALLAAPEPGLSTWRLFVDQRLREVAPFIPEDPQVEAQKA